MFTRKRSAFILVSLVIISGALVMISCKKEDHHTAGLAAPEITAVNNFTNQIVLTWKKEDNAKKYEVQYGTDANLNHAQTKEVTLTTFEVTALKAATIYYIRVRFYTGSAWSKWSDIKKAETAAFETTVETFNVCGDSAYFHNHGDTFGIDAWNYRRLAFRDVVLAPDNYPDILALQEMSKESQMKDIISLLKGSYDVHINSRIIDPRTIFWKRDKYSLVDFSDDIEGYDNTVSGHYGGRYISYVRLKEKTTGKELLIFDIHPNSGGSAEYQRMRGILARRVADTARKLSEKYQAPAVILGDFNNYANTVIEGLPSSPMVVKSFDFTDTFDEALQKTNSEYQSYDKIYVTEASKSPGGSRRLDYIFTYPQNKVTVSDYRIIIRFKEGSTTALRTPRPSDHHPVRSTLHLFY